MRSQERRGDEESECPGCSEPFQGGDRLVSAGGTASDSPSNWGPGGMSITALLQNQWARIGRRNVTWGRATACRKNMWLFRKDHFERFERLTQKSHSNSAYRIVTENNHIFTGKYKHISKGNCCYSNPANSIKSQIKAVRTAGECTMSAVHCFSRCFPLSGVVFSFGLETGVLWFLRDKSYLNN